MRVPIVAALFLLTAFAGCLTPAEPPSSLDPASASSGLTRQFGEANVTLPTGITDAIGDATVVAVVDFGMNPYHWDFLAAKMPQHLDNDTANDLPLDRPASEWLPGFDAGAFASYTAVNLTLDAENKEAQVADLRAKDDAAWGQVKQSTDGQPAHVYWFPGTKVIAAVDFVGDGMFAASSHGVGSASVSVGNIHGTCPECLFVFVGLSGEDGLNWAMSQPWIDAVTNSYGFSADGLTRSRLYSGSDLEAQRAAVERGQQIFFSGGNGADGAFLVSNPTLFSSQEGPDWIVTVGAIGPSSGGSYSHGKPADVASVGSSYPSAGAGTVTAEGTFGGTSSATPTTTGMYSRSLWWARSQLAGPSRMQAGDVIASGDPLACGAAYAECELGDGQLTRAELRTRLLHGAVHTAAGQIVGPTDPGVATPPVPENEFLSEGHGSYFGRLKGDDAWLEEVGRITGPLTGEVAPLERPAGEVEWMTVLSYCTQHLWGEWAGGYYVAGESSLPGPSPLWPVRSAIESGCPYLFPPV